MTSATVLTTISVVLRRGRLSTSVYRPIRELAFTELKSKKRPKPAHGRLIKLLRNKILEAGFKFANFQIRCKCNRNLQYVILDTRANTETYRCPFCLRDQELRLPKSIV
jgi:hypothetical protein